ncbi:hypothetical protein ACNOYE_22345 [Nannocystaceae bacterium ST9]
MIAALSLSAWIAWFGEPVIAPHAHAELGVLVRDPPLDQPGITVKVPPAAAVGVGVGLVMGPRASGPHAWLALGVLGSLAGRAIESLDDGSVRARPARSQVLRVDFGVVLAPHERVQIGVGLGYALRAFGSPVDERIAAQSIHAPHVVVPVVIVFGRASRVALRLRPTIGPSVAAAALADRSERDLGLGVGAALELDLRLLGRLALRLALREDHELFFPLHDGPLHDSPLHDSPLHDAQHAATLAVVFDANPWTRPRP